MHNDNARLLHGLGCLATRRDANRTRRQGKRLLLEALASGESALKLSSAIASARKVFREKELQENAELQVRLSSHRLYCLCRYIDILYAGRSIRTNPSADFERIPEMR